VNKDGKDNLDYKWEAKGFTDGKDDNLKFDKDGDDKGKLFLNKPRTGNERIAAKRAESEARMKEHNERRNAMLSELKDDGIVPKDATEFSIHINDQEMVVNGVKQPQNVFNKYREKIRKNAGKPSPPNPAVSPAIKVSPSTYKAPPIKFGPTIKIHPDIKLDPVLKKALAKRQLTYSKPATNASKTT